MPKDKRYHVCVKLHVRDEKDENPEFELPLEYKEGLTTEEMQTVCGKLIEFYQGLLALAAK